MANATSLANRIEAIFDEEEPEQSWLDNRVGHFVSLAIGDLNCLFIKLPSLATFKFEIFKSNVHLTTPQWVSFFCGHVLKVMRI